MSDVTLPFDDHGLEDGPPVVFLHALGTDRSIWSDVVAALPSGLRSLSLDLRGHGAAAAPNGPYPMGALISDVERTLESASVRDAVVVGLSLGGLIAQGLAVKRLDLVRALVLSSTAVKIGTAQTWADRAARVREGGMAALVDDVLARWLPPGQHDSAVADRLRRGLLATDPEGYAGCCAAIGGTDFLTPTSGLRLPTLVLAGDRDGATPPDLVRDLADLIPGARFELLRGAGHVPPVDSPSAMSAHITTFLHDIGHA